MVAVKATNLMRRTGERKYAENCLASTAITNVSAQTDWAGGELDPGAGTVDSLCYIPQGSGYYQRIGRKVNVKKVAIRGTITVAPQVNQTAADQAGLVRLVLYKDTKTAGVQAQAEQVMGDTAQASLPAASAINQFQNPANFGRFQVFKDVTFRLTPPPISYDGTNVEQGGYSIPFKMTWKGDCVVNYTGTATGFIADIVDNSFHLIGVCAGSLAPQVEYNVRTYFDD